MSKGWRDISRVQLPPTTGICLPTWRLSKPTSGVLMEVLLCRHDRVPPWPLVIELRDPLASLEILEGGTEIARALITWLGFPAASPQLKLGGAQALSHLISIRKPAKVASPRRTFLGTLGRDRMFAFSSLSFYFIFCYTTVRFKEGAVARDGQRQAETTDSLRWKLGSHGAL